MNLKANFCRAVVALFVLALTAAAQNSAPQNVLEYFLAVPEEFIGTIKDLGEREKTVEVKDLKNGYLKLSSPGWDGWGEVALFKNSDGSKTLGLQTIGCGPGCGNDSLFFVQYKNGKWIDVTKEILPEVGDAELLRVWKCLNPKKTGEDTVAAFYEFPRIGTTVKLIDDNNANMTGKTLYEFAWNGAKFTAKPTRNKACKAQ